MQRTIKMGLDTTLQRKGLVLDSLSDERRALLTSDSAEIAGVARKYNEASSQLATMTLSGPGNRPAEEYRKDLEALEKERESLEGKLAELSSVFASRKKIEEVDSDQISELLHSQSVLIEFVKFTFYDFQKKMEQSPRYIAYILVSKNRGGPILIDLGDGDVIDRAIYDFRQEISRGPELIATEGEKEAEQKLKEKGKKLYELIFLPLSPHIFSYRELYLCTDGNLNLIPFSVFSDENGSYLIERYQINYLSSGRDLLRYEKKKESRGNVVILAGPDYNARMGINAASAGTDEGSDTIKTRSSTVRSFDLKNVLWTELPGTISEAETISSKLSDLKVDVYVGEFATEKVVKNLDSPSILHIATHGFFLEDQNFSDVSDSEEIRGIKMKTSSENGAVKVPAWSDNKSAGNNENSKTNEQLENPLLRSGLVFAGANNLGKYAVPAGEDDGILTALEISGLRLWDTDMVVLSACETGLGEVHKGEGVFGLRRAFQLAGARTIVMSMWEVPDKETIDLMSDMYSYINEKARKSDALHFATLKALFERRAANEAAHPFFWGAFVIVGDP